MGSLRAIFKHPDDLYPMIKLKLAMRSAEKQIPPEPHWGFCYSMLHKVSRSFALVIQQLDTDLRDAICIFYLVLRALDTIEDDTGIAIEVKVPILIAFHRHIYDREWHFSCGTKNYKVLMDEFHHVSTAFLELGRSYQEAIEDITMRMGAGMAKFICKEVETVDDYDEYCHYVAGLVGLGLSKLFHASGKEDLASDALSNSMGLFLQKTNIIRDYLEDINEIPKSRMFWPRQIWSKYVNKLEDLKYEENSDKALHCLNDMVTNALIHAEDCITYMSALRDPAIFRFCVIPQIMAIGTLALCYNNVQVFRGVVKMRRGLTAKIMDRTKTMSDVYGAFYDFSRMLKSKVDENDPNARKTKERLEAILKICRNSGSLNQRKSYIIERQPQYNGTMIVVLFIILAILAAYLSASRNMLTNDIIQLLVFYGLLLPHLALRSLLSLCKKGSDKLSAMDLKTLTHNFHLRCQYFQNHYKKANPKFVSQIINLRIISCRKNRSIITNCSISSRGTDNAAQTWPTEEEKEVTVTEKRQFLEEASENIREELSRNGSLWDQMVEIVKFSGPAVGLWICGPLMSLIDTVVVGQGSSVELAALGPGTVLCDYTSALFMFLSIATSNLVATSLARQDKDQVQHQISVLLFIGLVCGVLMLFITKCYGRWALTAFAGAKNLDIIMSANTYVQIRALVWPAWLVGWVAQSASLGMKDSWGPVKALAVASAINGVGDIVLCRFLGFGIAGAAWATMVSQIVAAYMMIETLNKKGYNGFAFTVPTPNEFLQIFMIAAPAFVAIMSKTVFYALLVFFATSMGTKTIAAHQVMIQLYCICAVWGEPLSQTAQSFMPELIYGANRSLAKVRKLLKTLVIIGGFSGLILGSIGTSLPWLYPNLFSSDSEVISEIHKVLIPFFVALFAAPPINCLEGTLMAGRDLKFLSISMTGIACLCTLVLLLLSRSGYGLRGCWFGLVAFQLSLFTVLLRRLTSPDGMLYSQEQLGKPKTG